MSGWTHRWGRRLRSLLRRAEVERELDEELALHLELETEKNLRLGMDPAEARRRAAIAFGASQKHREEVRDARWLGRAVALSPDVKLALRMLVKNPELTVIGAFGMAVAIAVAAGFFTFMSSFYYSTLPFEEGDRIVAIENRDIGTNSDAGWRATMYDLHTWRAGVRTVQDIGAYRTELRDVQIPDGVSGGARVRDAAAARTRGAVA